MVFQVIVKAATQFPCIFFCALRRDDGTGQVCANGRIYASASDYRRQ